MATLEFETISLDYSPQQLFEYYNALDKMSINDYVIPHDTVTPLGHRTKGKTVGELKKTVGDKQGSHERKDIVATCDRKNPIIKKILDEVNTILVDAEFGNISFFLQKAGNDIPLHADWPVRKNCLLIIPIIVPPYEESNAITYYDNGGSYKLREPVIMDVMKAHGVKNIDKDRLALHIEIPNLTAEEVDDRLAFWRFHKGRS